MLLDDQIVAIERAFVAAGIPHAFGGAQALVQGVAADSSAAEIFEPKVRRCERWGLGRGAYRA